MILDALCKLLFLEIDSMSITESIFKKDSIKYMRK